MTTEIREQTESHRRRQSIQSRSAHAPQLRGGVVGILASFTEVFLDAIKDQGDADLAEAIRPDHAQGALARCSASGD